MVENFLPLEFDQQDNNNNNNDNFIETGLQGTIGNQ